jgi:hypothetical protein
LFNENSETIPRRCPNKTKNEPSPVKKQIDVRQPIRTPDATEGKPAILERSAGFSFGNIP